MRDRPLPPFAALRAFEAAARLGSFRDAAVELRVSPSAVSHQIAGLEANLGLVLFQRSVRAVTLTPEGAALARELTPGFDAIQRAVERARGIATPQVLRLSALPLITNAWLIPRLAAFEARHPGVTIAIDTTNRVVDLHSEAIDLAIRNTPAATPGLVERKLVDVEAVPLCSPAVAAGLKGPEDLAGTTLIHLSARPNGWGSWLDAVGQPGLRARGNIAFDTVPSCLEAARRGQGVMLGISPLVFEDPAAADLVVPFATPRVPAGAYVLVHRKGEDARPLVRAFADWAVATMRTDRHRLERIAASRRPQTSSASAPSSSSR